MKTKNKIKEKLEKKNRKEKINKTKFIVYNSNKDCSRKSISLLDFDIFYTCQTSHLLWTFAL